MQNRHLEHRELAEREWDEGRRNKMPWWAWLFPIFFGFLGGLISWLYYRRKVKGAIWLLLVGIIWQIIGILFFY